MYTVYISIYHINIILSMCDSQSGIFLSTEVSGQGWSHPLAALAACVSALLMWQMSAKWRTAYGCTYCAATEPQSTTTAASTLQLG